MKIINAHLLTSKEIELINEVINFKFTKRICFRDYDDIIELEVKRESKTIPGNPIDIHDALNAFQRAEMVADEANARFRDLQEKLWKCYDSDKKEELRRQLRTAEEALGNANDRVRSLKRLLENSNGANVVPSMEIFGEFVDSPTIKVILYLEGYPSERTRYLKMIGVFVHEMFHAVNFFMGHSRSSIREIDEPMVEFATGVFLDALSKVDATFGDISREHYYSVGHKATGVGEVVCYGFGRYLIDCVAHMSSYSEEEWIETYADKSASIDPALPEAKMAISALYPFYPVKDESKVLALFEKLIFWHASSVPVGSGVTGAPAKLVPTPIKRGVAKSRAKASILKVTRQDGTVLQMAKAKDTLILAILEAGILRVYDLKIQCFKAYLVDDKKHPKYAHAQYYEQITKLYILHHSNTLEKKQYLDYISNALGLGWKVEII